MQLRRFTGDSTPLALGAVREALGDEAIILSNRQVDGRVEIVATAMLDERALAEAPLAAVASAGGHGTTAPSTDTLASAAAALSAVGAAGTPGASAAASAPSEAVTAWTPSRIATAGTFPDPMPAPTTDVTAGAVPGSAAGPAAGPAAGMVAGNAPVTSSSGTRAAFAPAPADHAVPDDAPIGDLRPLTLGRPVAPATARDAEAAPPRETTAATASAPDAIEAVLARIERRHERQAAELEERLRRFEVNLWGEIEPIKAAHLRQLLRLGIGAELGVRLAESVVPESTPESAMRRSLALLKASVPIVADDTADEPGVTVLSGPAGGGKTTALVKLATHHVQRRGNQSLVMIAADNRRIGAFESLQVYGRLLGVPVVQAHDGEELASLIEAFAHKWLVLVDHVPPERSETMPLPAAATLGSHDGRARRLRHLMVLPATLESRTLEALVERHAELGVTAGVLTQLDRAARLGVCLAPLVRHQLGIAYWSDNARVQTPLERANASVLVATVMATGGHLGPSVDEELLLDLLQPTRRDVGETLAPGAAAVAVSAVDPAASADVAERSAGKRAPFADRGAAR